MGQFLEWMELHTGWQFSYVMGGPDPLQDGDIRVIRSVFSEVIMYGMLKFFPVIMSVKLHQARILHRAIKILTRL